MSSLPGSELVTRTGGWWLRDLEATDSVSSDVPLRTFPPYAAFHARNHV